MHKIDPNTVTPVECPQLTPERQLLWDAAKVIERCGHQIGNAVGPNGERCMIAAMMDASKATTGSLISDEFNLSKGLLGRHIGSHFIARWSDTHTPAEVIQALRDAALS